MLNPFAPHITEELWNKLGHTESIAYQKWPDYDEEKVYVPNKIYNIVVK